MSKVCPSCNEEYLEEEIREVLSHSDNEVITTDKIPEDTTRICVKLVNENTGLTLGKFYYH